LGPTCRSAAPGGRSCSARRPARLSPPEFVVQFFIQPHKFQRIVNFRIKAEFETIRIVVDNVYR
jgi:hypothetical protein